MATYFALALLTTLLVLAALAGAQTRTSSTPLITTLNEQAGKIRQARAARCLSPARFRWHPGYEVPSHMRQFVIGQRRARLADNRAIANLCDPVAAIRFVFGPYADQALRVAYCESRYSTRAVNGQYLGLFQMGSSERATYGHSSTALGQARAAYRYFVASGRDWSPWACKP